MTGTEKHYSIAEIATLWGLSERTIRRMLDKQTGILVWGNPGDGKRRRRLTVRVPESVLIRIHSRLCRPNQFTPLVPDATWREYLKAGESESKLVAIRRYTHTGRPLGSVEFVRALEKETKCPLALQKRGPKKNAHQEERQDTFSFG